MYTVRLTDILLLEVITLGKSKLFFKVQFRKNI